MRGGGREDIAAVKCAADILERELGVRDHANLGRLRCIFVDHGQDSVIGRDKKLTGGFGENGAADGADAGVDDDHVNGAFGEVRGGFGDGEGAFQNVEGRDVVRNIYYSRGGGDRGDHTLHGADKMVGGSEVGGERDQAIRHEVLKNRAMKTWAIKTWGIKAMSC